MAAALAAAFIAAAAGAVQGAKSRSAAKKAANKQAEQHQKDLEAQRALDAMEASALARQDQDEVQIEVGDELAIGRTTRGTRKVQAAPATAGLRVG